MGRIILGVIVGFIVWSIVWVGGEQTLANLWGDFGNHSREAEKAFINGTALQSSTTIVLVNLVRSFITSLLAGYMTALVAGEYKKSTMVLGIILVLVGVAVEYLMWNLAPTWYHILFVLFLLPMTVVGGKLRRAN
ncbi:MAG: hypothetical protein ABL952_15850 [Pyrinomonadaceae bacterium]